MPGVTGNLAGLEALADALEGLERAVEREALPAVAEAIGATAAAQYTAGRGPDGRAWPRNKDGSVPLRAVTAQITFAVEGSRIVASGPDVLRYHEDLRPVFPAGGTLPGPWRTAAEGAVGRALAAIAGRI